MSSDTWQHLEIALSCIIAIAGFYWRLHMKLTKLTKQNVKFEIEHEILVDFYCKTTGVKREDLPTRHKNGALR